MKYITVKGQNISKGTKERAKSQTTIIRNRVKQLAKDRGISQKEIAEAIGKTPETLSRILHRNPTLLTLQQIADFLGVPVFELFSVEDQNSEIYGLIVVNGKPIRVQSISDLESIVQLSKKG